VRNGGATKDTREHRPQADIKIFNPSIWTGENMAGGAELNMSFTKLIQIWIDEKVDYNISRNFCTPGAVCGHYKQVISRATTEIGCGINRQSNTSGEKWKNQASMLVCNYSPG